DRQTGDAASTLELYRSLLHLRKELGIADGTARVLETRTDTVTDTVAVEVTPTEEADGSVLIVANLGTDDWLVPADRQVIAASRPGVTTPVPVDCTVWLAGPGSHVE
ncbi:MAG: DUF3459 domain-containing protein, partial [Corynebacterium variabile]|nr:DUF3459 domain-containing protein [Corynebacterium variabile]